MCVTNTARTGCVANVSRSIASHASLPICTAMPVSTITQPSSVATSHTLMWFRSIGSGMRAQRTPGATSTLEPGAGAGTVTYLQTLGCGREGLALRRDGGSGRLRSVGLSSVAYHAAKRDQR